MCRMKLFWVSKLIFGYFEEKNVSTTWITRLRAPSCGLVSQIVFLFLFRNWVHSIHPLNNFLNKWTVGKLGKLLRKFVTFYIGLLNGSFLQLFWRKIVLIYTASKRIGSKSRTCCIACNQRVFSKIYLNIKHPMCIVSFGLKRPFMPSRKWRHLRSMMYNHNMAQSAKSVKVSVD